MYNILIFGTGSGCKDFIDNVDFRKVNILAYIDNDKKLHGKTYNNKEIIIPENIYRFNYDYIVITSRFYDNIYKQLIELNVDKNKILGLYLNYSKNLNDTINYHIEHLNKMTINAIEQFSLCNIPGIGRQRKIDVFEDGDFVRLSSLELVADEIYDRDVRGNVAELGVFRGDFAKLINKVFYDRKLYLFDTFEGFNETDINIEKDMSFSASEIVDFKNTSVEIVLSKMQYPDNCIIKKGYFPDTLGDIDESFAFVSIDADLYLPILNGLEYFYPRLVKGGYIFIHDYNNSRFKGAKAAVKKYCSENEIAYFPLSDLSGSIVITK